MKTYDDQWRLPAITPERRRPISVAAPTWLESGATGPQGAAGLAGVGTQGAQGPQGAQGGQGIAPQGPQGDPGDVGVQGTQGLQGAQGEQVTGPQGDEGDQGVAGAKDSVVSTRFGIYKFACLEGARAWFVDIAGIGVNRDRFEAATRNASRAEFRSVDGRHKLTFAVRNEFPEFDMPQSTEKQRNHSIRFWNQAHL